MCRAACVNVKTFKVLEKYNSILSGKVSDILSTRIQYIQGIGDAKAELMQKELGVFTIGDLLGVYPFRYIDKTKVHAISQLNDGDTYVQVKGKLLSVQKIKGNNGRHHLKALLRDESGVLELAWFQGVQYMSKYLKEGDEYLVFGKVTKYGSTLNIVHPEMENVQTKADQMVRPTLEPVYPSTEKLDKRGLDSKGRRKIVYGVLKRLKETDIPENLPRYMTEKLRICSRYQAFQWIHFPADQSQLDAAVFRMKYEEIFIMQLKLLLSKKYIQTKLKGAVFATLGTYFNTFYHDHLLFELTGAQKRVLKEIRHDFASGIQMNRLLQGDVGSGKTIVAFMSMLMAIDNGYQACMMAPTEILAQQHYTSIEKQAAMVGLSIAFLSGTVKGKRRKKVLEDVLSGEVDILIGTHALIENHVQFSNLGLVVIDEQHRFGVAQRAQLWKKNKSVAPHILIMSATPIPRTLSMTVFGDLDVSLIDELPPGRKDIKTIHARDKDRMQMVEFMKQEIARGRQIYVVFPLIEESAVLDLANLQQGYESLLEYFPKPDYQISVVHGKMKAADKDYEMQRFVNHETQIMVATTVIEVGVNVPNASVMIIENTERFGLSQLHQLRGRVGRGAEQSYCILVSGYKLSKEARFRIKTMLDTTDGFKIAEADLQLRGPGDIMGTRQSGELSFKHYNLVTDHAILDIANKYAVQIAERDENLSHEVHEGLKAYVISSGIAKTIWQRIS